MHSSLKRFLIALIFSASSSAYASSVTYDYTGTVLSATGVYSSAGSTVSGTITINFGAANPSQSGGILGSPNSSWYEQAYGGTLYGLATPAALVFSSTINSGGINYASAAPSSTGSESIVEGHFAQPNDYFGSDTEYSTGNSFTTNTFQLLGAAVPWDFIGLPILGNATSQANDLTDYVNGSNAGQLNYTITSLTAVPLPASAWLMLSGLGGLGVLVRKKRAA